MKLEPHGIRCELHAREPRPFERILALLDVLLGGASTVVERQDQLVGRLRLVTMKPTVGNSSPGWNSTLATTRRAFDQLFAR